MTRPAEETRAGTDGRRPWRSAVLPAALVAAVYLVLAGAWIAWSDSLLPGITSDPSEIARLSIIKGWGFVLVTGLILFAGVVIAFGRGSRATVALGQRALELETANAELSRAQALYAVSSGVARAITAAGERQALLDEVCRVAVEEGGLAMAWIGRVTPDGALVPEAHAGSADDFLDTVDIQLDDPARSRGPAATAIRERRVAFSDDIATDPALSRWREKTLALGYRSAAAIPILVGDEARGALTLYASTEGFFDHSQIRLFEEIASDVTFALEHLEAQRALVDSELRLSSAVRNLQVLIDTAPAAIVALDVSGKVTLWNPVAEQLFGWKSAEVVGARSPFPPESGARHFEASKAAIAEGRTVSSREVARHRRDGSVVDVAFSAAPIFDEDGVPAGTIGVFVDITERKRAEEAAAKSFDQLETMVRISPLPIILIGADFDVVMWNAAAERVFGWTSAEIVGRPNPIVPPDREHERIALRDRAMDGGAVADLETVRVRKDGTRLDVSVSVSAWRDSSGQPAGTMLIVSDVTERKEAERRQSETLDRLETLVGTSPIAIAAIDTEHRVTLWNPAAERLFGWTADEVIGRVSPVVSPDPKDDVAERRRRTLDGGATYADEEVVRLRRDGAPVDVSVSTAPLRDAGGTIIGSLAMWVDITERKRAQEEVLRLNEELEQRVVERTAELTEANRQLELATRAKSAFLATMSHELRTPLNSIIGFSAILREQMAGPLNEEQAKQLDIVYQSARHLLQLINGVLTLSKVEAGREELVVSGFDLDDAVASEVERVRPLAARKGLDLVVEPAGAGVAMRSDRTKFGQILLNLLSNAIKFTDAGSVRVVVESADGRARVSVRDTGRGIAPSELERIFDDFYQVPSSPDEQGSGTGLGLPLSRRLAQLLRGTIEVSSVAGEGSEFTLAIPVDLPVARAV